MYDRKKLKRILYKKGWRQFWGKGYDKWVHRRVIKRVMKSLPFSSLRDYAISWREALLIEYKRAERKK